MLHNDDSVALRDDKANRTASLPVPRNRGELTSMSFRDGFLAAENSQQTHDELIWSAR